MRTLDMSRSQSIIPTKRLPMLYNLYQEVALKDWKCRCRQMSYTMGDSFLFNIHFADDQIVIAQCFGIHDTQHVKNGVSKSIEKKLNIWC